MKIDDTIVAIATPLQPSGLGVIRISGVGAISVVEPLFRTRQGSSLQEAESHKLLHGWIEIDGEPLDEVLLVIMRAPHSYTTEDVVEIQSHGSPFALRTILEAVLCQGARLAEPGEFTQRAFLHGRLDLTQVEAVADLIHAHSQVGVKLAAQQLRGRLYRAIEDIRKQIVKVASLVEATIEFPEENTEFTYRENCLQRLNKICANLENLLARAAQGRQMREGFGVALIGRPNVGKSSLLNTLLREQRAIVTAIPGTTRDTLEEAVQIQGLAFRLTDTAGIRQTREPIETAGIRRSRKAWDEADLILLILDSSVKLTAEDWRLLEKVNPERSLIVFNKSDLISGKPPAWQKEISGIDNKPDSILISAKTGEGCRELEKRLYEKATSGKFPRAEEIWITNRRQQEAAQKALDILRLACEDLESGLGEEYLAVDLRSGLNALGAVVGETTADDLLEQIFAEFCIGK